MLYIAYIRNMTSQTKKQNILYENVFYIIYIYIYIYMYYIINIYIYIYIYICICKIYFHKIILLIFSKAKYKNSRCGLTKYCKFA